MDGQTLGAILGFIGVVVTAVLGFYAATRGNKNEKEDAAKNALDATKDEAYEARILLRDEQIADLKEDKAELEREKEKLRVAVKEREALNAELMRNCATRVEELEAENDKLALELRKVEGRGYDN